MPLRPLALAALALLGGCGEALVDIAPPEAAPRLVLESLFAADSALTLTVRASASAFEPLSIDPVQTATVRVYEDGVFAGEARYAPSRLRYVSDVRARPGRTYRVAVTAPGFPDAEAEDTVPEAPPFDIVSVEAGPPPTDDRDRRDVVTVRFADPPGDDRYALVGIVTETQLDGGLRSQYVLPFRSADPALADGDLGGLLSESGVPTYQRAVFRDTPFAGRTVDLRLEVPRVRSQPGQGEVRERLRLARLSEAYYAYVRAQDARGSADPFGDPAPVPSNVDGGYGIVAAFAATERVLER